MAGATYEKTQPLQKYKRLPKLPYQPAYVGATRWVARPKEKNSGTGILPVLVFFVMLSAAKHLVFP